MQIPVNGETIGVIVLILTNIIALVWGASALRGTVNNLEEKVDQWIGRFDGSLTRLGDRLEELMKDHGDRISRLEGQARVN